MKKILVAFLILIFSVYTILTFLFAFNGYPGFIQDSTCFLPTAYFINHYHQLINPLYDAGLDPIMHRFLFYPPLFPYTVAYIIRVLPDFDNTIQVALTIIDFFSVVILLASVYIYCRKKKIQASIQLYLFLMIWLLGLFSFYGIIEGRPEVLSRFFIACFLLNNIYRNKRFYNLKDGLIIGLNLITSPISTFYLMVIKLGLIIYQNDFKLKPILQTITGFAIIIIGFTIVYPYHITELIAGLHKHSQNVIVNRIGTAAFENFIRFYISYSYVPFCIFNFIIAITYVYYVLIKRNKTICIALLTILTGLVAYFSFKDMAMNYNMLVLAPLCFFLLFVIFTQILNTRTFNPFLKASSVIIILLMLFVNSIGFIRKSLLFFSTEDNKVSYQDFRKDFIEVYNSTKKDKKIIVSFSLWPYCLDKFKNITMSNKDTSAQYMMIQQLYSGQTEPQPQPGFKLIKNSFITKHPKFGKLPLGNTYPWFQTAVYERK